MIEIILTVWQQLLYVALAGFLYYFFNELEDESIKSNWKFWQQWMNTKYSSTNKWATTEAGYVMPKVKHWWYFGLYQPIHKERYIWSSTILVFPTDGEHFFQFIKNIFILIGVYFAGCLTLTLPITEESILWLYPFYGLTTFLSGKLLSSIIKELFLKKWIA